jgi:hypothetical protein
MNYQRYRTALSLIALLAFLSVAESSLPELSPQKDRIHFGVAYDVSIPTPESVLGYAIGERFTDYRNLERYCQALADASDRVTIFEYGTSYEGRPLRVLYISTPGNLSRLEETRSGIISLTDPRSISDTRVREIVSGSPVFVWLAYNVHGNEASATEAALITMYHLAASIDPDLLRLLNDVIIVLDPLVNPDGRERYVGYVNSRSQRTVNPDPQSIEHSEPWPRGRSNHYFFDLNRDWAWLTQRETRQRVNLYNGIMPQVYVDYHEMGYESTYFFFPATPPFHPNYPEAVQTWGERFGRGNAAKLDRHGIPYYTREIFDLFYPGYGDSWPTFNGAIGMTYEQAGGGMGRAIRREDEQILTLAERARNHFLTAISTIETAAENRQALLEYFSSFWEKGIRDPGRNGIKSIIMREGNDPNRTADLVNILLRHNIEVLRLTEPKTIRRVSPFYRESPGTVQFPAGSYVVNFNQPKSRLARTLLEPHAELPDTFFFDITAWSLPAAYHVDAFMSGEYITSDIEPVQSPVRIAGRVHGRAQFAYLVPWERDKAAALVWDLLQKDYSARYALRSFTRDNREYTPGTIIFYVNQNPTSLHEDIIDAADRFGIDVYATDTGLSDSGIDLGSNYINPVRKPRIAVATDRPVIPSEYGEIWFLFDEVYGIPFTPLRTERIPEADLSQYDLLILPGDGTGGGYAAIFDSTTVEQLRRWIRGGGVLITVGGASRFVTREMSGLTTVRSSPPDTKKKNDSADSGQPRKGDEKVMRMGYLERQEYRQRDRIAGALFNVTLDRTHPLSFGYERDVAVLKRTDVTLQLTDSGYNVGIFSGDGSLSGYAVEDKANAVLETAFLVDYQMGRGHVVMFSENPHFRMFWHGLTKIFLNACMFLP